MPRLLMQVKRRAGVAGRIVSRLSNWLVVLLRFWAARVGVGAAMPVTVRSRQGLVVTVPAATGSMWPVLEVLALDCYHISTVSAEPNVIVDIGAHVGSTSLALHHAFPAANVICYEPSPPTVRLLRANLAANGLAATVHDVAVGGTARSARLASPSVASGSNSLASASGIAVEVVSFDEVMASIERGPVLVKMDCEGTETAIIEESAATSFASVQTVLVEHHPADGYDRVAVGLARLGFTERWHDADRVHEGLGVACWAKHATAGAAS